LASRTAAGVLLAAVCVWLAGCVARPAVRETLLSGQTMGSAWTVKLAGDLPLPPAELQAGAQAQFDAVNLALSTWRADSDLSRFNADQTGEWLDVGRELALVMEYALSLAEASGGSYDITVGPLVNLWGFGPDPATRQVPDAQAIATARARVGWRKVEVDVKSGRARKPPGVHVDLSSLGKGRGVDRVAAYLDAAGVTNYLIDLSGKLRARGRNAAGTPWRVAVERPSADAATGVADLEPLVVSLRDESVATAGDYRRFFESGGRHYSHIIDPRSGEPVSHHTVSATSLGADCMQADALATVFMVMPPDAALALADRLRARALLIGRDPASSGDFTIVASEHWRAAKLPL
jgi:thiamine biosynthesis lipoprotein